MPHASIYFHASADYFHYRTMINYGKRTIFSRMAQQSFLLASLYFAPRNDIFASFSQEISC